MKVWQGIALVFALFIFGVGIGANVTLYVVKHYYGDRLEQMDRQALEQERNLGRLQAMTEQLTEDYNKLEKCKEPKRHGLEAAWQ